jgi:tetratricopeptide (TPR) repeat protein
MLPFRENPRPLPEVGAMLNAGSILEGSIRRQGEQVRISVQLVDAGSGTHLWAETYDRDLSDIFAIQAEVALKVSGALHSALTPETERRLQRQYTGNIEAYKAYLQGRLAWNEYSETGYKRAIDYFSRAIELDPTYSLAYAGLADSYHGMSNIYLPPSVAIPKARKAAARALELDESVAEAHTSLAIIKAQIDWDWKGAEAEYRRALELQPGYATAHQFYGWCLMYRGRLEEALNETRRAEELDPLSSFFAANVSWLTYMNRDYDKSIALSRAILVTDSTSILGRHNLGLALLRKGMLEEAIREFVAAVGLDPGNPFRIATLGHAYGCAGRAGEAEEVLTKLRGMSSTQHVDRTAFAIVYTGLGQVDAAFRELDRALEARTEEILMLKVDPFFDPLRGDPRYGEMIRAIGLE